MSQGAVERPINGDKPLPPEFFTDPGPDLHGLNNEVRATCPFHAIDYPPGASAFVVADYETAVKTLADPRLSKQPDNAPAWFRDRLAEASPVMIRNMITADPPEHTRLRKLVSRAFVPRKMELLAPRIQQITDDLIDGFPESGEIDLMEFAFAVPVQVICEFLRVPPGDQDLVRRGVVMLSEAPYPDEERNRLLRIASDKIESYLDGMIADRRANLGEDLVSELIRASDEHGVFTNEELISTLTLLLIAGHKTTANLIGNGMQALLRNPDQFELLRDNPDLAESAVEEFLRFESPVFRGTLRLALEDMEINGTPVPKESFVHVLVSSANRDPDAFENADELDISRSPNKHV
ncbi:MAG TPA: cytochrome P450, partial [Pseudonocardiaceae bacterium]|nr:cytochrome P450 [Pseudonocardiaceae bacterium]